MSAHCFSLEYIYIYIYIYIFGSHFLMLWMIQQQSTFLRVIIAISLILTLKIVNSWQPLQTKSWNLNPWLKKQ